MDDQDKNLSKSERAKDVAKTFVGMINYTDSAYDPDLTLDEFESEYKNKLKKAKPEEKSELEELLNVISILKKQQEIVDKEMKIGDFNLKVTSDKNSKSKEPKTKEEAVHEVKRAKEVKADVEYEEEKKKKKKKEKQLKEQADLEIMGLSNEQSRTKNDEGE